MKRPGGQRGHAAAIETRKPDQGVVCPGPWGDPNVARMAEKRKRCVRLVPHVLAASSVSSRRTPGRPMLLLQLPLQRLDLLGECDVLGDQRLDLAHGMENRGVIAPAEAAADLG